jgi:hypothetical protein
VTPAELAGRTDTNERSVREWLNAQAAGGYVEYEPEAGRYRLPPEHAFVLADEDSPAFMPGAFELMAAAVRDEPKITESFRHGAGVGWHEHDHGVFEGCERFFRPGYQANLVGVWIPALEGVEAKLRAGARVADVGCGHGASTLIMARAFPASTFVGYDYHDRSVEQAAARAREAGAGGGVPGDGIRPRHDLRLPARHGRPGRRRAPRPRRAGRGRDLAHRRALRRRHGRGQPQPVGRVYYGASTLLCTPASLSQPVGLALGAQAGEARLRDVVTAGGFTRFRRAAETPFNLVLEARP